MRTADVGQGIVVLEIASQRDRRCDLPALDKLLTGFVDPPMNRLVEMLRFQKSEHAVGRFVVDEDGTEQCLFGFDVVGRFPVGDVLAPSVPDGGEVMTRDGLIYHWTAK